MKNLQPLNLLRIAAQTHLLVHQIRQDIAEEKEDLFLSVDTRKEKFVLNRKEVRTSGRREAKIKIKTYSVSIAKATGMSRLFVHQRLPRRSD